MRRLLRTGFITFVIFLFAAIDLFAQSPKEDSVLDRSALHYARECYHASLRQQTELYSGIEYVPFQEVINEGHPYFFSSVTALGTICYDGLLYEQVPMLYDLVQDVVVIIRPAQAGQLQLYNELVDSFVLFDHPFIRLVKSPVDNSPLRTGFYEILYRGGITLLKKETKEIKKNLNEGEIDRSVEYKMYYYIEKEGHYYPVSGKGSFLDVMADKKKEVRQFLSQNNINLGKGMDEAMTRVAAFYDGLVNQHPSLK